MMGDTTAERADGAQGRTEPGDLPLPPGPSGYPVVGNTPGFVRDPFAFYDTLAEYGDVVRYSLARIPFTAVLHPDHVEQVLLHDHDRFEKWTGEQFVDLHFAPEGLVFTEGEQWRRQRSVVQDAFTLSQVESYADAMGRFAAEMVEGWDDGETVALNREFSDLTLRVLAHTLLDLDVAEHGDFLRERMDAVNARADGRNVSNFLPGWVPTPLNRRYRRAVTEMRSFVEDRIEERRRAAGRPGAAGDANARRQGRDEGDDDLLSLLLSAEDEAGRTLSDVEVRDQMITFLGAGTETTALALTYAVLELAKHDDVRRKLDEELAAVLGGDPPSLSDLGRLSYTENVVRETLRLYPPAYATFREAAEDVAIGGYRVPEGTKVTVPQFFVHTDGRWYDDPETFRPGRWTDGFEEALPDYAYFPFGGGPRHCIGMRFAMLELKLVLPTVARAVDFELLSDPDPEFTLGVTLQPAEDVRMRVRKR